MACAWCQPPFTASLNALPAVNFTVFAAGIWISAPVAGLRPTRAARAPVENEPNPISCTVSPFVTAAVMVAISASSVSAAAALVAPVFAATASTSSYLFIVFSSLSEW